MQKPPRPGSLDIRTPIHTIGVAPDHMTPAPLTSNDNRAGPIGHGLSAFNQNLLTVQRETKALEQEYQNKSGQLPQAIEAELASVRTEGPTDPLPPSQSIIRELGVLNTLTQRKAVELQSKTATANTFFGGDPFNRHINEFMIKATKMEPRPGPNGIAMQAWAQSLRAGHDARLLSQTIQSLNQRTADVQNFLRVVQANEEAQRAAAELVRRNEEAAARAREQARLAALENARRVAEEQARVAAQAAAQQVAAERALLEAQAESKRQAEQLRAEKHAAEIKAQDFARQQTLLAERAEAERLRLEHQKKAQSEEQEHKRQQARLEAQAEALRLAEQVRQKKLLLAQKKTQKHRRKQARLAAQAEAQRHADQSRLQAQWREETEARWQNPTFANAGSTAAYGPAFAGTTGAIGNSPAMSLALRTALRTAVTAAIESLATLAAPALVGFAALVVPSRLGNGDLYSVSVPLSELAPVPTANLYEQAAVGGAVDLPVTLGSKTIGNKVEIIVVTTDGVTIPTRVPVNLAHFDTRKNVYVSGGTVANGPVITWTPLVDPLNPSTDFPLTETDLPIYEGATVTPNTGRVDPYPEFDRYGFGGFITVFPIDSGLPPIFTLLRDRRQDPGIASGAGQSVSGNWLGASATLEGAPIPKQIADKLRGREFSSFDAFRREFWRKVANDEFLMDQFSLFNKVDIRRGLSPSALPSEQVGGRQKFEIHHIIPISEGGSVYDLDNLRVLTPKQHIKTHSKKGDK